MKRKWLQIGGGLLFLALNACASVRYVDLNNAAPAWPYTNWPTAAAAIQDAVDASVAGDEVVVTNGVYSTGQRLAGPSLANRVVVAQGVVVRSVNGPLVTIIQGCQVPGSINGDGAVRCVYLASSAVLAGFTLTNGATSASTYFDWLPDSETCGGGVLCEVASATVSNCVLTGNSAAERGGGSCAGTLISCSLTGNSAPYGGGADSSGLINCTLAGNSAIAYAGGAHWGTLHNCIVYYNRAPTDANYSESTLDYSCTTPLPDGSAGNLDAEPQLASASHLSAASPCRGAGSAAYAAGTDIDGEPWANPPSMGCAEFHPGAATGGLSVDVQAAYTTIAVGFPLDLWAGIVGWATASRWEFGDGTVVSNRPFASHIWSEPGDYTVVVRAYNDSNPDGISGAATVHVTQPVHYVAADSATPAAPYSSWETAAANIQDAVDAATVPGAVVLVTNGVYQTGERMVGYYLANRLVVAEGLTVRSVNGPAVTIIQGYQVPGSVNGDGAVRCVYLANGATLAGFTLTNGATSASPGAPDSEMSGGGIFCASLLATVSNCVLAGNSAAAYGGGSYSGTLNNCSLTGNSAGYGGAASSGTLGNCTLAGNAAGASAGGAYWSTLNNCILYYNRAPADSNYCGGTLNYCCTAPPPAGGAGNLGVDPQLASASHLSAASPCRGAGSAAYAVGTDIDGELWANPPSMGCDEFHPGAATGGLSVNVQAAYTNVAVGFPVDFSAGIAGRATASRWEFGDGTVVSNRPFTAHSWSVPGDYAVVVRAYNESNPDGISAAATVHVAQPVHYVAANSTAPVAPYSSWATAAADIQDAVDAATVPGALVLVTNGVYAAGGRAMTGGTTNRVLVTKPLVLQSVNGPEVTIIQGCQVPGNILGDSAVRCVALTEGDIMAGFTLTGGATLVNTWENGGGLWCGSATIIVSNCVLADNAAFSGGGGAYGGMLNNCVLTTNLAYIGGGAMYSALNACTLMGNSAYSGAGAYSGTLSNCSLAGNVATYDGGGAYLGALMNCMLTGNSAARRGGGACSATLNHCKLAGNSATDGGGAYAGALSQCVLNGNSASSEGGGANSATMSSCAVTGNSAYFDGGGSYAGTLNNCTLTGNWAYHYGGGASAANLNNCVVYYNQAVVDTNWSGCILNYCCSAPLPAGGTGNIQAEPGLADAWRLSSSSPCRGAGSSSYALGTDFDGEPWADPPSMGCAEVSAGASTGRLTVSIQAPFTTVAAGFEMELTAEIHGRVAASQWDLGNGTTLSNRPYASSCSWSAPGDYLVVLWAYNDSHPGGISTTTLVHVVEQPVHYVKLDSAGPRAPFLSWEVAATNIQEAVDAATVAGALVLVSNGVYAAGGRAMDGTLSNRVAVTMPLVLRSLNGPGATMIQGCQAPDATHSDGPVRPVYLASGAMLVGFTLTNGATSSAGDTYREQSGGGVWCASATAIVSNCVLTSNSAFDAGGGAYFGTLLDCTLTNNFANEGGGAYDGTLRNCGLAGNVSDWYGGGSSYGVLDCCSLSGNASTVGGGAHLGTLNNCLVASNSADLYGGGESYSTLDHCSLAGNVASYGAGAYYGVLDHCTLTGNAATNWGGGSYSATFDHSTLAGNSAPQGGGTYGGTVNNSVLTGNWASLGAGAYGGTLNNCTLTGNSALAIGGGVYGSLLNNCIVYYNLAESEPNYYYAPVPLGKANYSCTFPLPSSGLDNFTNAPQFMSLADGDLRLQSNSPCINAGANAFVSSDTDLDGNPRVAGGTVDVGAYEFQTPASLISYAWLEQFGLATDGSADFADADGDGFNNWQEWKAGTDPLDPASALRMLMPVSGFAGLTVTWTSVTNRTYLLERASTLGGTPAFSLLQTNITGLPGVTSYTDRNAAEPGPFFYRVKVEN